MSVLLTLDLGGSHFMVYSRNIGTLVLSDIKKHQYICRPNAPVISLKRHLHALAISVHKFSIFFWALLICLLIHLYVYSVIVFVILWKSVACVYLMMCNICKILKRPLYKFVSRRFPYLVFTHLMFETKG